jgi:ABC-2 type transport system ATP-binding protein
VAGGSVEELRAERAGRRWRAELERDPDGWDPGLPGVRALGGGVFELDESADPQGLLEAVQAAGPVLRFGPERPSLAELFREVVAERPSLEEAA